MLVGGLFKVDGYFEEGVRKRVFEFYGCEWYGCGDCYILYIYFFIVGRKMGDLFINIFNREVLLRGVGYEVESMWECRWRRLL